jgi:hypothetical protein
VAAALLALCGAPAQAQTPACFEVVAARAGVQPAILVDKCSGRTWQLARPRGGSAYRWVVLPRNGSAPAASAAPADTGKCFTFEGRKFCE